MTSAPDERAQAETAPWVEYGIKSHPLALAGAVLLQAP